MYVGLVEGFRLRLRQLHVAWIVGFKVWFRLGLWFPFINNMSVFSFISLFPVLLLLLLLLLLFPDAVRMPRVVRLGR